MYIITDTIIASYKSINLGKLILLPWSHVLHFGGKNERYDYKLCNLPIKHVTEEKDLGVIISEDLKAYKNVAQNVKEANKILGMIRRIFLLNLEIMFTL